MSAGTPLHRSMASQCMGYRGLSDWERSFLTSIADQHSVTHKQGETLRKIVRKVSRGRARQ